MSDCSVWDYLDNLELLLELEPGDRRLVPLNRARGDFSETQILRRLGIDRNGGLRQIPRRRYVLFGGHRGCGKSTELRRLSALINRPDRYFVVFVDALKRLDINNLCYSDILLAQAQVLVENLADQAVPIDRIHLRRLEDWFHERIEQHTRTIDLSSELKAGVKAEVGLPWIAKLFAELTNAIKVNSTHKEEIRDEIRNSFTEFASAFNQLIAHANEVIAAQGLGRCILFVVDGTDRLNGKHSDEFFIRDIHQLGLIESCFVYCAPIDLLTEQGQLRANYDAVFRLPMVKLVDKAIGKPDPGTWELLPEALGLLRQFVYARLPLGCFDSEETVDYLIRFSGGHPRDLLHLLNFAFQDMTGDCLDRAAATSAVRTLQPNINASLRQRIFRCCAKSTIARRPRSPPPNKPGACSITWHCWNTTTSGGNRTPPCARLMATWELSHLQTPGTDP